MTTLIICVLIASLGFFIWTQSRRQSGKKIVILLGPPGSGKGTQAVRLCKELKVPHISTGDLFRENLSKKTPLGDKAKSFMDKGHLVPDEIVLDMLFKRVSEKDCEHGFLLDGFPRTMAQAEAFDARLEGGEKLVALNLEVSDEAILKRMSGRLTCKICGHVHNKHHAPPLVEGICDRCGGELYQRADDNHSVVQERLRVYHKQTKPLIDFYEQKGVIKTVNGEQSTDTVFASLLSSIK